MTASPTPHCSGYAACASDFERPMLPAWRRFESDMDAFAEAIATERAIIAQQDRGRLRGVAGEEGLAGPLPPLLLAELIGMHSSQRLQVGLNFSA